MKNGGRSLLEVAFGDRTCSFSDDVAAVVEGFLQTMAPQMAWSERLQGIDPRIADVLQAPEGEKKRDHEDGCVASSTAAGAFEPKMRVTWAPVAAGASQLSDVDRVCYDRWAKRATDLLREADVPAWTLVKDTVDPGKRLSSGEISGRYCVARKRSGRGRLCRRGSSSVFPAFFRGLPGVGRREVGSA